MYKMFGDREILIKIVNNPLDFSRGKQRLRLQSTEEYRNKTATM